MKESKRGLIVSSNDLIQAKYNLTLWQKRVFLYFVSEIEKEAQSFEMQRAYIVDLIKFYECDYSEVVYEIIANIPRQLFETAIEVPHLSEKGYRRFGAVRLITKYTKPDEMEADNAYIEFKFNDDLKPHLLELKKQFAKYDLKNIVQLQSIYSIRLFEILKSYEYQKTIELEVEYLKALLQITEKYKLYADFKRFILDKAQKDLLAFCDISFLYKELKKGRKVNTIRFAIQDNAPKATTPVKKLDKRTLKDKKQMPEAARNFQQQLQIVEPQKQPPSPPNQDLIREQLCMELLPVVVSKFGVSLKVFMSLIEQHTEQAIRQAVAVTDKAMANGKVDNSAGFFVEAVRGQYVEAKQQQKQKEAAQKAKQAKVQQQEQIVEKNKTAQRQAQHLRDTTLLEQLINADSQFVQAIIDKISSGLFGHYYDKNKSFEDNRTQPLVQAAILNAAKALKPEAFA